MPVNYPSSLDTNSGGGATLPNTRTNSTSQSSSHPEDHNDLATAIVALETKVGTGSSTPATPGHVLTVTGAGASAWQAATSSSVTPATGCRRRALDQEPQTPPPSCAATGPGLLLLASGRTRRHPIRIRATRKSRRRTLPTDTRALTQPRRLPPTTSEPARPTRTRSCAATVSG
jgi:hypothetical protein